MLTSSLEESRQQPLFTSNTEPSQLCRHGSPASDSAPHAVIGLTDFLFPAQKNDGEVLDPPGCKFNLLPLGASRFLGYQALSNSSEYEEVNEKDIARQGKYTTSL